MQEAREADNTGTIATEDRFENYRKLQQEKERKRQAAAALGLFWKRLKMTKDKNELRPQLCSDTSIGYFLQSFFL